MKKINKNIYTFIAITALIIAVMPAFAQSNSTNSNADKKTYPPGSAWTLSWPLGTHIESTLDTTLYNYQRRFITALTSDAWASTGQFQSPGINMLYFDRTESQPFYFDNAISNWIPTFTKQKFYNVYIPFTQLSYGWGIGTQSRTDHLKATFAGNVNRKIGVGAWLDYPYTKGAYNNQATKGLGFGFSVYYTGHRYEMQAFFNHYDHLNKENGGITNDLYISNPAELQGGVNSIQPKSIPVNLSSAHNRNFGNQFYMTHAYKLGFWRDITQPEDSVEKKEYVPVTRIVYTFDYKRNRRFFKNENSVEASKYWENTYFDSNGTNENDRFWSLSNTIGIEMVEGFQKWAKFGLMAYATYELDKYRYEIDGMQEVINNSNTPSEGNDNEIESKLTPLPAGYDNSLKGTLNRLWVGGRIEKTKGSIIRYSADAKFGLTGDVIGDVDIRGDIETRFRLGKDTVRISANGFFRNSEPNYMLKHYVGNHFIWNNDFGKIRSFRAEGKLYIPWSRTQLRVGFENVQNQVYFGPSSTPLQHGGSVQVFTAAIDQKLKFGIWNWDNTLTYQTTSNSDVIPLPAFTLYSNMYLYFKAFKALTVQFGVDCNWYTKYTGLCYQPATMTFHTQGENAIKVGNYINSDVYLTCKLYKVRFFVVCSHLNQGWFSKDYFSMPHYPIDPRQFRVGLCVDFTN